MQLTDKTKEAGRLFLKIAPTTLPHPVRVAGRSVHPAERSGVRVQVLWSGERCGHACIGQYFGTVGLAGWEVSGVVAASRDHVLLMCLWLNKTFGHCVHCGCLVFICQMTCQQLI